MKRLRAGFTLIELLVVIGLIAVLTGVLGLSLGRGNSGTALQSAQSTASALVAGARAQAATSLSNAGLFVNVSPASEGFLNEFYVATEDGANWVVRGDASRLPRGVFLVPDSGDFTATNVIFDGDTNWTSGNRRSTAFAVPATSLRVASGNTTPINADSYRLVARFTPRGTIHPATMDSIVFAPAERVDDDTIRFNNAAALRGMTISNYGITTLINDADAF